MRIATQPAPEREPEEQAAVSPAEPGVCPAIEIENLTKTYGANRALDNISFQVKKGEIMGFLGPNGAGKSTTMNILTGYLAASGGRVRIDGIDITEDPNGTRRKIGYLPEQPPLYTDMTVKEYLHFVYDLKGIRRPDKGAHLRKVMEKVRITNVQGRLIQNLSKGYRQRVGLAQALIGDPEVLVLDEPTVGLDPAQILEIRQVISELGMNRTVILSTHILQEVSAVCDSYTIINHGRIAAAGSLAELNQEAASGRYLLRIKGDAQRGTELLQGLPGLESAEPRESEEPGTAQLLLTAQSGADIREGVFLRFAQGGCPILAFGSAAPSLEELFMQVISADAAKEAPETPEVPEVQEAPAEPDTKEEAETE